MPLMLIVAVMLGCAIFTASVPLMGAALAEVVWRRQAQRAAATPDQISEVVKEGVRVTAGSLVALFVALAAAEWLSVGAIRWLWGIGVLLSLAVLVRAASAYRWRTISAIVASFCAVSVVMVVFFWIAPAHSLWMLEGTSHDFLYYYQGVSWGRLFPQASNQANVAAQWQLGTCADHAVRIGAACDVFRDGTYSLLALATAFIRSCSPGMLRVSGAAAVVMPVLGLLPVFWKRFVVGSPWLLLRTVIAYAAFSAALLLSVGIVDAYADGEMGALFAGAALVMLTCWAIMPTTTTPMLHAAMLGLGIGVSGLLYGESAILAAAITVAAIVNGAFQHRRVSTFVSSLAIAALVAVLALNHTLIDLYRAPGDAVGMAAYGVGNGHFIGGRAWWWLSTPFTGEVSNATGVLATIGAWVAIGLMLVTLKRGMRLSVRAFTLGTLLLTLILVSYVSQHGYAHGERMLVQLLGPVWVAQLVVGMISAWHERGGTGARRSAAVVPCVVLLLVAGLAVHHMRVQRTVILAHVPTGSLRFDFANIRSTVSAGDTVVADVSSVADAQRFMPLDYAATDIHRVGARLVLPLSSGSQANGYTYPLLADQFRRAGRVQWYLQLHREGGSPVFQLPAPILDSGNGSYSLYDFRHADVPLAVAGKGWLPCESDYCWTEPMYTIEAQSFEGCRIDGEGKMPFLKIDQTFLFPAQGGTLNVSVNGGGVRHVPIEAARSLVVDLPKGWSEVTLSASWQVKSPVELGASADDRRLFARISSVTTGCR